MNPRSDKLSRTLKSFTQVDGFDIEDLEVGIGTYAYSDWDPDTPTERRLYWCTAHLRARQLRKYRHDTRPWSLHLDRGCGEAGQCRLTQVQMRPVDKDIIEVWHLDGRIRHWYLRPRALRDDEDFDLYRLLRDRGDDPDTARNTVLGLSGSGVDRLLAQLRMRRAG